MTSIVHADLYDLLFSPFRKSLRCSAGVFIPFGTGRAENFFEVAIIQLFLAAQQYLLQGGCQDGAERDNPRKHLKIKAYSCLGMGNANNCTLPGYIDSDRLLTILCVSRYRHLLTAHC